MRRKGAFMQMRTRRRRAVETFGRGAAAAVAATALGLGVLAAPAHAADAAPTPVLSTTFDDGTVAPWTAHGGAKLAVVDSPDGAGKSLEVTNRTAGYDGLAVDLTKILTPGVAYTVTFEARLADASQPADGVHFTVDDGSYTWVSGAKALASDAWTTVTGTYTLAAGATKATMYLDDGASSGPYADLLVDDLTITGPAGSGGGGDGCTYPTSGTVISSGFEDGSTDGWVARDDGHGTATVAVADGGHASDHALAVTARQGQGQGVGHDVTCLLKPGKAYELTGWVRFADGQPRDDVWLSIANTVDGSTTYSTLGQLTDVANSGWTQVTQKFTMPATSDSALLYFETKYYSDGSAGNTSDLLFDDLAVTASGTLPVQDVTPIKDTLPFPVGAAVSTPQLSGGAGQLLARHFDQVTPENTMKPEGWYDADHQFVTTNADADALMQFAQQDGTRVYGHTLVWYQQTPDWFFQDDAGRWLEDATGDQLAANQQLMRDRLKTHIDDVARYLSDRYGKFGSSTNPLVSFDVVNEVVSDNAGDPEGLRQSHWYKLLGESYIEDAFRDADQAFNHTYAADGADRPVSLFINDYSTESAGKRQRLHDLVTRLIADDVPVDGVGHQFHVTMATPVSTLKDAIEAFKDLQSPNGHPLYEAVTELDVPTGTPVTQAKLVDQGYYYKDVFDMLRAEAADGAHLFSATVWGLLDGQSWRADSGAPLLFDDELQAKPAYYGVTDQDLPAKALSAVAFQQAADDVDATDPKAATAGQWDRLPLHPIGDDAGFQLRWSADHLTAYVSAKDPSVDAGDKVTLTWAASASSSAPSTATVGRDGTVTGTGVTASVASTATGWEAVVNLPVDPALTSSSTPGFDVTVTDGTTTTGWNSPGTLGTLTLIEPLSFTTVPEAATAPTIDGTKDAVWDSASTATTSKRISGATDGAKATVHQLWKDHYLYVLAEVTDPTIDVSSPNAYEQDSVEIFTDPGNAKSASYVGGDAQMRINADNVVSFGTGDEAAQAARLTSATARTATGYVVEARIDLGDAAGAHTLQGLDYEVNDGTAGARTANFGWAEPTGTAYQTTARWGVAELVPAAPSVVAPVVTTQPADADGRIGKDASFTARATGTPAPTITWQQLAPGSKTWTTLAGEHGETLSVHAVPPVDGARYRAVFTNEAGSVTSDAATLTVVKNGKGK